MGGGHLENKSAGLFKQRLAGALAGGSGGLELGDNRTAKKNRTTKGRVLRPAINSGRRVQLNADSCG